jgi:hypothetical protein
VGCGKNAPFWSMGLLGLMALQLTIPSHLIPHRTLIAVRFYLRMLLRLKSLAVLRFKFKGWILSRSCQPLLILRKGRLERSTQQIEPNYPKTMN